MHHSESGIEFFVLAAPGRAETAAKTRASIEASDIGTDYTWCEHPTGVTAYEHWSATFQRMATSEAPLVVLFEDDCLVNKHLIQNVRSWSWPDHPEFGAGWLYNPGGYCAGKDVWYTGAPGWYGTVAVLYWRDDVLDILKVAQEWMAHNKTRTGWDCAVAWAVNKLRLKIRAHGPPLVEHQHEAPSLLDHQHSWSFGSTRGTWQEHWLREGVVPDAHTRRELRGVTATRPLRPPPPAEWDASVLQPVPVVEAPGRPVDPNAKRVHGRPPSITTAEHKLPPIMFGNRGYPWKQQR